MRVSVDRLRMIVKEEIERGLNEHDDVDNPLIAHVLRDLHLTITRAVHSAIERLEGLASLNRISQAAADDAISRMWDELKARFNDALV